MNGLIFGALLIAAQFLMPLGFIAGLPRMAKDARVISLVYLFTTVAIACYVIVAGAWMFWYWLRFVLAVALIAGVVVFFIRFSTVRPAPARRATWIHAAIYLIVGLLMAGLLAMALRGWLPPDDTVDLAFPLSDGLYIVGQGGASDAINGHYSHPAQRYALDIVKLNAVGARAKGLGPPNLDDYAIYGDDIHAPCAGEIVWTRDGIADVAGANRDPETPAGNAVGLQCGDVAVLLAHFATGTVAVQQGQIVEVGDVLGKVGNTGNTTEPHLHIHAERGEFEGERSGNPGLAMTFDDRFLVRSSLVRPERN